MRGIPVAVLALALLPAAHAQRPKLDRAGAAFNHRPAALGTTVRQQVRPGYVTAAARTSRLDSVALNPQPLPPKDRARPVRGGRRPSDPLQGIETTAALHVTLDEGAWAPRAIDFGELRTDAGAVATATVTVPGDGPVTARLSGDARFQIVRVTPFTGRWDGIGASARPRFGAPDDGAGRDRRRQVTASAGQEVRVEVRFGPGGVGRFDGKLHVEGDGWGVSVPLTARATLLGPLAGALAVPQSHSLIGIAGTSLDVPVQMLSLSGKTTVARVTPTELPPGVSAEPLSVALGPGERKGALLRLRFEASAVDGRELPLRFAVDAGGATPGALTLSLNLYQPWVEYPFSVRDTLLKARGALQLKSDGSWQLRAVVENEGPLLAERAWMSVVFLGDSAAPVGWEEELRLGASSSQTIQRSGTSAWLKDNYGRVVDETGVTVFLFRKARSIPEIVQAFR